MKELFIGFRSGGFSTRTPAMSSSTLNMFSISEVSLQCRIVHLISASYVMMSKF
jgi:hypothetical protein